MTNITTKRKYDDIQQQNYLRERSNFSFDPSSEDYPVDMLPPLSCPRLVDKPREMRHFIWVLISFIFLTASVAILIWIAGWDENQFEMTSVTSTRELRPVPKQLIQMMKDPNSLRVIYHGYHGDEERDSNTVELLVLVDSIATNYDMRQSVRETWMTHPSVGISVTVVFTIAGNQLDTVSLQQLQTEAERYGDVAIFPDSSRLPESEHLLYILGWAQNTLTYHYLLRTKDRYYVQLEEILSELDKRQGHSSNLYWGYFEGNRAANHKWHGKHVEPDWFLCTSYIRFAHSGGYVISSSLSRRLVKTAEYLQLYQNEDIAMATWLSPFGDVEWKHDVRFDTDPGQSRGCQNSFIIFPTNNHGDMIQRHQRLAESGRVCRKEHFILHSHSYDFTVLPAQCCHEL